MWPNRLPGYFVQPQTNLIPVQIPLQSAYVPQPLIANQVIPSPFAQQKIVYGQPLQYRPVLNSVIYPSGVQYLPYRRPEVSHITSFQFKQPQLYDDSKDGHTTPSEPESIGTCAEDTSISSRSSNHESPPREHEELPIVIEDPFQLNDFTNESARFYNAFYKVCCEQPDASVDESSSSQSMQTQGPSDSKTNQCNETNMVLEQCKLDKTVLEDKESLSHSQNAEDGKDLSQLADCVQGSDSQCAESRNALNDDDTSAMNKTEIEELRVYVAQQRPMCQLPL